MVRDKHMSNNSKTLYTKRVVLEQEVFLTILHRNKD